MGKHDQKFTYRATRNKAEKAANAFDLPIRTAVSQVKHEKDASSSTETIHDTPVIAPSSSLPTYEARDTLGGDWKTDSDSKPDVHAKMAETGEKVLKQFQVYERIPKYPVLLLSIPTRLRGQTLSAEHKQMPTAFRIKPKSGFIEVEVPVPTYKHQRPDISMNHGSSVELLKKHPDDLSCGLSGGFTSASDGKDKGTMGNLTYDKLLKSYEEGVGKPLDTMIYTGRIYPPNPEEPIEKLMIFNGTDVYMVPVFARVQLRPGMNHLDLFRELEDVAHYSAAAMKKAQEFYGSDEESDEDTEDGESSGAEASENDGKGDDVDSEAPSGSEASTHKNISEDETYEPPGHDAEYPATDYADTEEDEKAKDVFSAARRPQRQSAASEAVAVNMSVKSSDEKKDERTAIQKRLDEIRAEKWVTCEWKDEKDPDSRKFFKTNFHLDEELKKFKLASMLTENEYLDLLSCPRFDATRGVFKDFFSWEYGTESDISDSSDSDQTEEANASEDGKVQ